MIKITVNAPEKTPSAYTFSMSQELPFSVRRTLRVLAGSKPIKGRKETFGGRSIKLGFTTDNFEIPHHELWDSFYPLFYLTRKSGPIYQIADQAILRFKYPIHVKVRDFFIERSRNMGIALQVIAPTYDRAFDLQTQRHILSLGGGKESRLLLGMLRELGKNPLCVTDGAENAKGVEGTLTTLSLGNDVVSRIVPALMLLPEYHYMGNTALGSMLTEPWQRYYDISSAKALAEMSALFHSLGVNLTMYSPTSVLCNNMQQFMLHRRYPELFKNQMSVPPQKKSQKNLHVTLCRMRHDIPYENQCSVPLFKTLLKDFVDVQHRDPHSLFGFRGCDEHMIYEMRSMIAELKHRPEFDEVRDIVPDEWRRKWFYYIHSYLAPNLDEGFMNIYRELAPDISECPDEDAFYLAV